MKSTALFLLLTIAISPMIFSVRVSKDRFGEIQNSISNFCHSIVTEGQEAETRYQEEKKWCAAKILEAELLVAKRTKEVTALRDQVAKLQAKIDDNNKAIKHYQNKIDENLRNMEVYKKQRCEANLIFITLLREHYDAEDLLRTLRKDIDDFLDKKAANPSDASVRLPSAFVQKLSSIGHLLPASEQTNLIQLVEAAGPTKYAQAGNVNPTTQDVAANKYDPRAIKDTLHVDNTRGELQKMKHIPHKAEPVYYRELRVKIDTIIDGLINHLENSKTDLSKKEMKANEDYAKFMIALEKENKELQRLIAGLVQENVVLAAELARTKKTLVQFEKLLKAAQDNLEMLRRMCKEKEDYNVAENKRRGTETVDCAAAVKVFQDILKTDDELRKLINEEGSLKASAVITKRAASEKTVASNTAAEVKIVF